MSWYVYDLIDNIIAWEVHFYHVGTCFCDLWAAGVVTRPDDAPSVQPWLRTAPATAGPRSPWPQQQLTHTQQQDSFLCKWEKSSLVPTSHKPDSHSSKLEESFINCQSVLVSRSNIVPRDGLAWRNFILQQTSSLNV